MNVFKFGGASVKDASSVKNAAILIQKYAQFQTIVVVSAMGKTTNALEAILYSWYAADGKQKELLNDVKKYHYNILQQLFPDAQHKVFEAIAKYFDTLEQYISHAPSGNLDFDYDRIISFGELISSFIISNYFCEKNIDCQWFDVRKLIFTDENWREGNVDLASTVQAIRKQAALFFTNADTPKIFLTQGFLGCSKNGNVTTLGREGSDYTAAIFSYALDAEKMTVWKDVPGILNADPKIFKNTTLLPHISYSEAIELTYYGATVIHPKTIKPLQNKQIPLHVRSFLQPESNGTLIMATADNEISIPSFIIKNNQRLISITPKNFSFIAEQNLSDIFGAFANAGLRINMMQNSAISFTACVSDDERKICRLFEALSPCFSIKYNCGLQLITIRHWTHESIEKMTDGKTLLLEQRNRTTVQMVIIP